VERWSGRYEVNIFYPTGTQTPAPPGHPARSQLLYRLSWNGLSHSRVCLVLFFEHKSWQFLHQLNNYKLDEDVALIPLSYGASARKLISAWT
jgi:hypothetical protein